MATEPVFRIHWTKDREGVTYAPEPGAPWKRRSRIVIAGPQDPATVDDPWGRFRIIGSMLSSVPVAELPRLEFIRVPEDELTHVVEPLRED